MTHLVGDDVWSSILSGDRAIVDSFELDGRVYLRVRPRSEAAPPARRLSGREAQVLAGVAMGRANKVIAYELGLSESTVSAYVRRASAKMGATSRVGLVRAWRELADAQALAAPRAA